jgi:hypothetical protein
MILVTGCPHLVQEEAEVYKEHEGYGEPVIELGEDCG